MTAWVSERKGVREPFLEFTPRSEIKRHSDFFEFRARVDKASLDIFWLRVESFEASDNVLFKKSW
jgi:hypothetical protein